MSFCARSSTARSSYFGLCRKGGAVPSGSCPRRGRGRHRSVEKIRALDDALDGVGERELHVVVHVDAHFLAGRFAVAEIFFHQLVNAARCKTRRSCPRRKWPWPRISRAFPSLIQLAVGNRRGGHEVHGGFVALVVRVLDHVQRGRNLVDVGRHADHVQHGILLRQDVFRDNRSARRRP